MKRLTHLPTHALVTPEATERLREKFRQAKKAAAQERFWMQVQEQKQPLADWPRDGNGSPLEDLPIG